MRPAASPEAAWSAVVACPAALSPSARRAVKAARPSSSGAEVEITPPWSSSRAEGSRSLSLTAESAGRPASGRPTSCRSGPSDRSSSCRPAASAKVGPADEGRTVLRSAGTMPRGSSTTRSARSVTGNGGARARGQRGRDARSSAGHDIAVERVADVPAPPGTGAQGPSGEVDDARVRFADADLVRIELDGESLGQAGLIEDGPVGSAGVGVAHDAPGHTELGGGVEELDEAGAQSVLGAAGGQFALEFAGMTDEDLAFGGRKGRSVEVAPDGAVVELGRSQQPRLAVLPIAQSDTACREDGRELVRAAVMSGPGQQLRGDPGDLEAGLGSL